MNIEIFRLLFDFGLTVLIWMVQLLVYPSFLEYSKPDLMRWHRKYVKNIARIVIPLMLGQLLLSAWQVFKEPCPYSILSFLVVLFLWGYTFTQFVPLHDQITTGRFSDDTLNKLVKKNWLRTAFWSLTFIYGLVEYFLNTT